MNEPRNWESLHLSRSFDCDIWEGLYDNVTSQYLKKEWDIIFGVSCL